MNEQSNLKRHQHCPMRTHVGNCIIIGGFCTSIRKDICDALHKSFQMGTRSRAKEGEWIPRYHQGVDKLICECSNCHTLHAITNFCPNCGAKMKGKEKIKE